MPPITTAAETPERVHSVEPIGTPPGGGSWSWDGYHWVRNEPAQLPAPDSTATLPPNPEATSQE